MEDLEPASGRWDSLLKWILNIILLSGLVAALYVLFDAVFR